MQSRISDDENITNYPPFLLLVSLTKLTLWSECVGGGDKQVKKRVLGIAVVLLAVAMLATPLVGTVMAGKGQEKLSIRLNVGSYDQTTGEVEKQWNSPKKTEGMGATRVSHYRGGDWGDPATHEGFMIVVDESGFDIEFDNNEIVYSCSYNAEARNVFFGQEAPPYIILMMKVDERWEINNGVYAGYIEISTAEKVYDYANFYEGIHTEGSFVGHGVINGQSVKLSGETGIDTSIYREGTVMGWP
jgi:hypothetical protein